MEFKWITVRELCELIDRSNAGTEIGFTFDSYEDYKSNLHFEPTGWYGIANIEVFDSSNIVIGYYGGGIDYLVCPDTFMNVIDSIIFEFCAFAHDAENVNWDANTMVCVDAADIEKC